MKTITLLFIILLSSTICYSQTFKPTIVLEGYTEILFVNEPGDTILVYQGYGNWDEFRPIIEHPEKFIICYSDRRVELRIYPHEYRNEKGKYFIPESTETVYIEPR